MQRGNEPRHPNIQDWKWEEEDEAEIRGRASEIQIEQREGPIRRRDKQPSQSGVRHSEEMKERERENIEAQISKNIRT